MPSLLRSDFLRGVSMASRGRQWISAPFDLIPVPTAVAARGAVLESSKSKSWLWLVCAVILLLFADGRNTIALAAWLAPACLLRFVRDPRMRIALPLAYVASVGIHAIVFREMIPIPWRHLLHFHLHCRSFGPLSIFLGRVRRRSYFPRS